MHNQKVTSFEHHLVLVGAGNAHLQLLRTLTMQRLEKVWVTLISDALEVPYSAMIPGYLCGRYTRAEIMMDLVSLCARAGVALRHNSVSAWQPDANQLYFHDGGKMEYDFVSLNCGSQPRALAGDWLGKSGGLTKSLFRLVESFEQLDSRLQANTGPFHFCIVGGGGGGCELALAARARYRQYPQLRITLVQSTEELMASHPAGVSRRMLATLRQAGVETRLNAVAVSAHQGAIQLQDGSSLAFDWLLQATAGEPLEFLRGTSVQKDARGFVSVDNVLRSPSHPNVFGAGDTVTLKDFPHLPKAGVYAVRQGPVLAENLRSVFCGRPLRPYRPQKRILTIFDTSNGEALLHYGAFAHQSRAALTLKRTIDKRWITQFRPALIEGPPQEMPCAGCGSKVGARALEGLRALGGNAEDVSSVQITEGHFECQSVDFLRSFVADPSLFAEATAIHALGDLYAAGAQPTGALMNAVLPYGSSRFHRQLLDAMLGGASKVFREENVTLLGGHTSQGPEAALGFAVTGRSETPPRRKGALKVGEHLCLTKPLGVGVLLAAHMRGQLTAAGYARLVRHLTQSSRGAAQVLSRHGIEACTDVTGFGLLGHLGEMVEQSGFSARVWVAEVPTMREILPYLSAGLNSSLDPENRRMSIVVEGEDRLRRAEFYDPQTCGGLLFSISAKESQVLIRELKGAGYGEAAVIGEVIASDAPQPKIMLIANRDSL